MSLLAGAACLVGTAVLYVDLDGPTLARGFDWSRVLFSLFVVVGTAFLGALVREQRRLRGIESQKVVVEERTRIARELHDVVAHHVSAIVIRAELQDAYLASFWLCHGGKLVPMTTCTVNGAAYDARTGLKTWGELLDRLEQGNGPARVVVIAEMPAKSPLAYWASLY